MPVNVVYGGLRSETAQFLRKRLNSHSAMKIPVAACRDYQVSHRSWYLMEDDLHGGKTFKKSQKKKKNFGKF